MAKRGKSAVSALFLHSKQQKIYEGTQATWAHVQIFCKLNILHDLKKKNYQYYLKFDILAENVGKLC